SGKPDGGVDESATGSANPWSGMLCSMRRLLLALTVLATATAAAASPPRLVERASREAAFTVRLPADWRYRDTTYPSDHSTELWIDPHDRLRRLKAEVSACVGCVTPRSCILRGVGCRPAPGNVVPAGTVSRRRLSRWALR